LRTLVIGEDVTDREGHLARRLDATPGATYLVRPDQHLAARWRSFDGHAIEAAWERARGGALRATPSPGGREAGVRGYGLSV
jgi:3-(3-hydroxy-phenyl)propionate hydroxylase